MIVEHLACYNGCNAERLHGCPICPSSYTRTRCKTPNSSAECTFSPFSLSLSAVVAKYLPAPFLSPVSLLNGFLAEVAGRVSEMTCAHQNWLRIVGFCRIFNHRQDLFCQLRSVQRDQGSMGSIVNGGAAILIWDIARCGMLRV